MSENITVDQLMTKHVVTLRSSDTLPTAEELMRLRFVRHLPVVDDGKLVGLVTHRDLLAAHLSTLSHVNADKAAAMYERVFIKQIMKPPVMTITPDTPILEACEIMLSTKIGCLPVVKDHQLVGILTEADFLKLVASLLEKRRKRVTRKIKE